MYDKYYRELGRCRLLGNPVVCNHGYVAAARYAVEKNLAKGAMKKCQSEF
jgi:hypothetical protein